MKKYAAVLPIISVILPSVALGYPNGTPHYVTDAAPFCASCHSSAKAQYAPELPIEAARRETPDGKHYSLVNMKEPPSPYMELADEQRSRIIKDAKTIDVNSTVAVTAPASVKRGAVIEVVVKARGGNGPTIGVMLVDKALRFQSRPVSADGWTIIKEPEVRGQGGAAQTSWLDRRIKDSKRNLNYVNIENQKFNMDSSLYPEGVVTYTLRAPSEPGIYTLTAAFLYGTENTDKAGFFQRPSGRILFSDEVKIRVE